VSSAKVIDRSVCFNLLLSSASNSPKSLPQTPFFTLSMPVLTNSLLLEGNVPEWCTTSCVHVRATSLQVAQATVKIFLNSKISDE